VSQTAAKASLGTGNSNTNPRDNISRIIVSICSSSALPKLALATPPDLLPTDSKLPLGQLLYFAESYPTIPASGDYHPPTSALAILTPHPPEI
jgi:hypothetical protein